MKSFIFSFSLFFFIALQAFCGGGMDSVNTQEIDLDGITAININYSSENVTAFIGTTDTLVIKEFLTESDEKYYATINKTGNTVTIKNGRFPLRLFFSKFERYLEVYVPASYNNALKIKTGSGRIEASNINCSVITLESGSGNLSVDSITSGAINLLTAGGRINIGDSKGNTSIETSSGGIRGDKITGDVKLVTSSGVGIFDEIRGNVSADTAGGSFRLNLLNGSIDVKTSSGGINCTVAENSLGDISFNTNSGVVRLKLPKSHKFNFSSRSSSGRLTAPFSDRLSSPVNDKNLTQGIINDNGADAVPSLNIRTSSGNIFIEWI